MSLAKLEAIQIGYESLSYIGKRQRIQRWEETFEYRDILNFLAETGGHIEIEDKIYYFVNSLNKLF